MGQILGIINIIYELKNKNIPLMIAVSLLLPFAFIHEAFAALAGKGAVIRKYFTQQK